MARHGHVQHSRRFVAGAAFLIATLVLPSAAFQSVRAEAAPGDFTLSVSLAGSSTAGTVTSVPTGIDCGSVCSHAYPDGAVVTLTQILGGPDADSSTFAGWSGDADCTDGTVTLTADLSCTATFDLIERSAESTTGAGPVTFRTSAGSLSSLTAVAEDTMPIVGKPSGVSFPFGFFSWTVDGLALGQPVIMTMTHPSSVEPGVAFWKVIGADWIDASSLLGSNDGDNVLTLTITDGGLGDADGIVNGSISDPGAVGVTPIRRRALTITKSGNGSGTVTSAPTGINCGLDCTEGFAQGTVVVLTATPAPGSSFLSFSGVPDCSDGIVTMTFSRICIATFVTRFLAINKMGNGTGTVTSAPAGINCGVDCSEGFATGTVVTLTAQAAPGSSFVGFTLNPDCYDGTVKMTYSFHCVATFVSRVLTVARMGNGTGTVVSAPPGINCGVDCTEGYGHGTVVVLTAFPTLGSSFLGFSGDPDCADGKVTMIMPRHCVAKFVSRLLTIEIAGNGFGTVTSLPAGIECGGDCREGYGDGTEVVLSATAAPGSTFMGFSGNSDCSDGVVSMTSQRNCVATFVSRILTVRLGGTGSGIVTSAPAGIDCGTDCSEGYEDGTEVVLSASTAPSSTFMGFSGNSDCTDGILTMTAARSCIATFKAVGS